MQPSTMALTATVGREAELDSIQTFIDAVPRGPSALSISGPAGIGKTILWEAGVGVAREHGFRVLMCRGIEAEASLSFAALSELITPVFDEVAPELTTPRRRALEVALLLADSDGAAPDPLAIGLAVFDSLRVLAANGPCVLAIDDAEWIDSSSATVLQTALKRLDDQPVSVLVTIRGSPGVALPIDLDRCFRDGNLRSVTVGPISSAALSRLLRDRLSIELGGNDVARLHIMTDGNPFFALEVGREMVRTNTRSTDPTALRVPDSLRELVGGRLARLPIETGDVLLEMAALARPTIGVLAAAHGDRERRSPRTRQRGERRTRPPRRLTSPLLASAARLDLLPTGTDLEASGGAPQRSLTRSTIRRSVRSTWPTPRTDRMRRSRQGSTRQPRAPQHAAHPPPVQSCTGSRPR